MAYAFRKGTSRWIKHDKFGVWSAIVSEKGFVYDGGLDLTELLRNKDYEEHGWWMWGAWTLAGLLLVITKRYAKKYWTFMHYAHALLGYFVLAVTIIFAMKLVHWHTFETIHNAFGTFTLFFTIAGALSGSITMGMMRFYNRDKPWSEKERIEQIAKIHRWFGYLMLLVGNVTVASGVGHYFGDVLLGDSRSIFGSMNLLGFVVLVAIMEAIYRLRNKFSLGHIKSTLGNTKLRNYTPEEVDAHVKDGKKLVLFDNAVLDINGYER